MFRPNTYASNPAVGQGIDNLAAGLFGDPTQEAALEQTLSRAQQIQQETRMARENRARAETAADLFKHGDVQSGMAMLMGTGDASFLPNLGSAALAFQANTPGATDDQIRRALIGSGVNPSENFASTSVRADEISARDAAEALRQAEAVQRLANEGKGADGTDWLDATRRQDLQNQMQTELLNQLVDMGLPSSKDGVRTDLLPPGLMPEVMNEAWTNFTADTQPGRQPAPISTYINQALRRRIGSMSYTDDNSMIPFHGQEELTVKPPATAADVMAPAQAAPARPAAPAPAAAKVPPPEQRVSGQPYDTPRGRLIWFVDPKTRQAGWLPPGA
jgi:hypothetical protein